MGLKPHVAVVGATGVVGRLRRVCALDNELGFWIAGDQLLEGAARNAAPIAKKLMKSSRLAP